MIEIGFLESREVLCYHIINGVSKASRKSNLETFDITEMFIYVKSYVTFEKWYLPKNFEPS